VVAGTDDMIESEHTRLIATSIPGAQLRFLEGSHFVAAEDPDAFNRVVSRFLSHVVG
jgi:pimeloyl-ACP methyl ester carboxylesterase